MNSPAINVTIDLPQPDSSNPAQDTRMCVSTRTCDLLTLFVTITISVAFVAVEIHLYVIRAELSAMLVFCLVFAILIGYTRVCGSIVKNENIRRSQLTATNPGDATVRCRRLGELSTIAEESSTVSRRTSTHQNDTGQVSMEGGAQTSQPPVYEAGSSGAQNLQSEVESTAT
jgi:hypothetical protein